MKKIISALILIFSVNANSVVVEDVKISQLYIQSQNGSSAHALRVNKAIDSSCNGRVYIEFADSGLLSTLLAYKLADKEFDLMYQTGQPSTLIWGHLNASCRLFSVY